MGTTWNGHAGSARRGGRSFDRARARPRAKGCSRMSASPYRKRKVDGKTVYEHRLVVERRLGRKLARTEHVHHKNEQKKDNADDNLELKSPKEHARHHFAKNPIVKTCEVCGRTFEPPQ